MVVEAGSLPVIDLVVGVVIGRKLRNVARLEVSPVFVNDAYHAVGIKVACHRNTDIVGDVVVSIELADVAHGRVLEVLCLTDGGLETVGVVREHGTEDFFVASPSVLCEGHILLFVNRLKLRVEKAQDEVLETVCL